LERPLLPDSVLFFYVSVPGPISAKRCQKALPSSLTPFLTSVWYLRLLTLGKATLIHGPNNSFCTRVLSHSNDKPLSLSRHAHLRLLTGEGSCPVPCRSTTNALPFSLPVLYGQIFTIPSPESPSPFPLQAHPCPPVVFSPLWPCPVPFLVSPRNPFSHAATF